ncbi:hypothetical protein CRUP_038193, partial [Coryphaenoides rupestris]
MAVKAKRCRTPSRQKATRKQPQDVTYLMKLSRVYEELCPELARFLMHEAHAIYENKSAEGYASESTQIRSVPLLSSFAFVAFLLSAVRA